MNVLFKKINNMLISRNINQINPWKSFLYYLLSGINKLPMKKETAYRVLDRPITELSKQYQKGSKICWIGFTSTILSKDVMKYFVDEQNKKGTFMMINIIEGRDISAFSLFPDEAELLLLPNSQFMVDEILSDQMKKQFDIPSTMDGIVLSQLTTPQHLLIKVGIF